MPLRRARSLVFFAALGLAAASGCADPPPPVVAGPPPAPDPMRCTHAPALPPAQEPPRKLEGGPAYLTPEGVTAGLPASIPVHCNVSRKGRAVLCKPAAPLPPSQEAALRAALATWRFQPATYDGRAVAVETDVEVPLVAPPPDWVPPLPPLTSRVIPFGGEGMIAPMLVAGPAQPSYTREALERCAEGKVVASCTITVEGRLVDCDVIQSVPGLDQAVLEALSRQVYTPVLYHGRPQSVFYTLRFNFKLP